MNENQFEDSKRIACESDIYINIDNVIVVTKALKY